MSSQISFVTSESVRTPVQGREYQVVGSQERAGGKQNAQSDSPVAKLAQEKAATAPALSESSDNDIKAIAAETDNNVTATQLDNAIAQVRERITDVRRELQFNVDESSGRTIITVIDSDSGKIIRQIPPEELLEMADSLSGGDINLIDSQV